jgi:sec-independent protein translocase protein TatC
MAGIAPEGVAWMTDIDKYLSFVLSTFVAFGVTFEVPVIVIVLVRMGFVTIPKLKEWRPYVIVGAFVIGAIFTPPDVVSQIMLAVPLCLLYELGILLSRFVVVVPPDETVPADDPSPPASPHTPPTSPISAEETSAEAAVVATPPSDWSPASDAEMNKTVAAFDQQKGAK